MKLEQIPERFAKLILEKPLPKVEKKTVEQRVEQASEQQARQQSAEEATGETQGKGAEAPKFTEKQRAAAKRAVSSQMEKVDTKIRTVGVLGMLTGMGGTAKGPAVVDVLGAMGTRKEHLENLDEQLSKTSGIIKATNADVMQQKLVKSKDVAPLSRKEEIDNLIAGASVANMKELSKRGDIVIQKPESIEGAASSNAKRDNDAINQVVSTHKASIRMSYEKFLRSDPNLAGKITVRFTITASGSVSDIKIVENSTGNSELEQEIIRKVKMWQFETIAEGDVTVVYPFVFNPAS